MGIGQGCNAYDISFADLSEKIGDNLVKLVMTDLDAIGMLDGFDFDLFIETLQKLKEGKNIKLNL